MKFSRFITAKPLPVRNRTEMNGDWALAECRTKTITAMTAAHSGPMKAGLWPPPR